MAQQTSRIDIEFLTKGEGEVAKAFKRLRGETVRLNRDFKSLSKDSIAQVKNEFTMTQSWATITRKSESHHHHDHPNTIFSAVYYAQAEGGLLEFSFKPRIREGYNFTYKIKDWNSFNSVTWRIEVKTGDIVIFPGWISHGTTENDVDVDRIVIGANFFVKGTIGTNEGVDLIEL